MLLVMAVSLYTVRIVLKALGDEDYGIYNVVAGVVTMLSFLSQTMSSSTQRFYAYEIGRCGWERLRDIFSISMNMYLMISVVTILVGETVGLWFINTYLVIPPERMVAANWIYQFSLASFVITMISIPYSAAVIAHEDMTVYAVISITDCFLKLGGAAIVSFITFDRLFVYGLVMMIAVCLISTFYILFGRHKYRECRYRRTKDRPLFKSLASFWGWNLFGSFAGVANNQGNNILINIFFGPMVNAARAVAFNISNAVNAFCNNFYMAMRSPLIKSYSCGDYDYMMKLFYFSNKFVYYLLLLICLPLILEMNYVLHVWLPEVTEYMVIFSRLTLIYSFVAAMHNPITTLVHATGKIKSYSIVVESVILLSLPLSYIAFKMGAGPTSTFWITISVFIVAHVIRLFMLKRLIPFNIMEYMQKFILPALLVTVFSTIAPAMIKDHLGSVSGLKEFALVAGVSIITTLFFTFTVGLNKSERNMLLNYLRINKRAVNEH